MNLPIQSASRRGVALVIVLGLLVIILGLAVTFLNRTTIERNAAAGFAAASNTRQLADTAVNLVEGQIRDATTQGANVAWASQPGMIRTFASGNFGSYTPSASLLRAYKLYSSDTMIATTANTTADLPPNNWETNKAVWTDLNAPVTVNGEQNFPILDPAAFGTVEGFTANGTSSVSVITGNSTDRRIPMPVRWLYVTKNGNLVAATGNGTVAGASDANPIIGRIAFWTDDETSKININTASEGTVWDQPKTVATEDKNFAKYQPAKNEFQRYPGHPAMTSLAPVFFATSATSTPVLTQAQRDAIYSITPRVVGGGSESGTKMATGTLEPDADRLYASVDELIFKAPDPVQPKTVRDPQPNGEPAPNNVLTRAQIERSRFFLTATSRAPEVTLFNTPRVSMWPLEAEGSTAGERTSIDKLFAFVSTINPQGLGGNLPQQYYFQRKNPRSATDDFTGIPRNQTLYRYLQALTNKPFPGFGGNSLATKYTDDRDQILSEMFDYIRITNPDDSAITDKIKRYGYRAQLGTPVDYTKLPSPANGKLPTGHNQIVPIRIGSTQGFGRFPVISEAGFVFIATADGSGFIGATDALVASLANLPATSEVVKFIKKSSDGKIASNDVANNKTLGGTKLLGEGFLDVGYGATNTGRNNGLFDFQDSQSPSNQVTGYPAWAGNKICDFEPWDDVNGNGLYDSGEPYYDANGNGIYDQEPHEPVHDWGRGITVSPPAWSAPKKKPDINWPDPPSSPTNVTIWPITLLSGSAPDAITNLNGRYDPAEKRIEALLVLETFVPGMGYPLMDQAFSVKITGLNDFSLGGQSLEIPSPATWMAKLELRNHTRRWGGVNSIHSFIPSNNLPKRGVMPADSADTTTYYPFVSIPITVSSLAPLFFSGGNITVEIYNRTQTAYPGYDAAANPVSKMEIKFDATTIPLPNLVTNAGNSTTAINGVAQENWWSFSRIGAVAGKAGRLSRAGGDAALYNPVADPAQATLWVDQINRTGPHFDVVRSVVPAGSDYRLVALSGNTTYANYVPHNKYTNNSTYHAHAFVQGGGADLIPPRFKMDANNLVDGVTYWSRAEPDVPVHHANSNLYGDWDTGFGATCDGAYINLPDIGTTGGSIPYYPNTDGYIELGPGLFSPNRQIPSPGMFGSLPSGAKAGIPWRTLLFRPQPGHPGANAPQDHLWTDLFWMPVVEPYAISEPFSTAGKINMNFQIAPFDYIRRGTGVVAALRAENVLALRNTDGTAYKQNATGPFRLTIDAAETLKQFETRFFVSPSQIMELYLVPTGQTITTTSTENMETFWSTRKLAGDNVRERPYANLLGRLTTKSNSYTVHYRVQSLKKAPTGDADVWVEGKDKVTGEYRGSTTIERYINPNDSTIPDYASIFSSDPAATPNPPPNDIGQYYKWRTVNTRQFAP
jgi:uncharacterized protein (TIGR02600 family)